MSGAGENRWSRRPGQGNPKDGRQQPTASTGNAWGNKGNQSKPAGPGHTMAASVPTEQHLPVRDFNANECKDYLKKKYRETVADQPAVYQKVQGDSVAKRSSGAWGNRGNMSHLMPNGQNFFDVLKKQLASIEQRK